MKKIIRHIHLWLSIPFGLVITLTCFTGAMLIFETEITQALQREKYFVRDAGIAPLPLDELARRAEEVLQEDVRITGISVPDDPERAYSVKLSKPKRAVLLINPYNGEILGQSERPAFFKVMFSLHRWLMDTRPAEGGIFWGKLIVGISTLTFVVILISGLIIWIPKSRKALKSRFSINLRKGWKRFLYDLHVAGGIYGVVLLLAMALTGLTWSFPWYRNAFYSVFGATTAKNQGNKNVNASNKDVSTFKNENVAKYQHWQYAFEEVAGRNPDFKQITVADQSAQVTFSKWGNQRASDTYRWNPASGAITSVEYYRDADNSGKIRGWIYSIHVGNWGGWLTRILWFLASLLGASLPLTGYYLWIRRTYKQPNSARTT